MKFGIFFVTETPDYDARRAYDEMLEQTEYAEHLGFDTVWLAEHHGSNYGSMPSGSVMAAAIAQRTRFIRIGMAVSILPFNNPVRIAEEYAMVDVLSHGRLDFGVGRGYQPREFAMLGLADKQAESREIFPESLDVILGLWTNERFSYDGKYYDIRRRASSPAVPAAPSPIYVAAISPETFSLVAERGYNILVTPTLMTLPELKEHVIDAKRRLIERGRDPQSLDFPMNWQMHVAPTEEQALAETEDAFAWYFNEVMKHVPQGPNVPKTYERYAELAKAVEEGGGLPSRACSRAASCGPAARRLERMREIATTGHQPHQLLDARGGSAARPGHVLPGALRQGGHAALPQPGADGPAGHPRGGRQRLDGGDEGGEDVAGLGVDNGRTIYYEHYAGDRRLRSSWSTGGARGCAAGTGSWPRSWPTATRSWPSTSAAAGARTRTSTT